MTEAEFIHALDHSFRFTKKDESIFRTIIDIACSWSENSALMAGFMLAIGAGSKNRRLRLLKQLTRQYSSPLLLAIAPVIQAIIKQRPVAPQYLDDVTEQVRNSPGVYNAICILNLADPSRNAEREGIFEEWK